MNFIVATIAFNEFLKPFRRKGNLDNFQDSIELTTLDAYGKRNQKPGPNADCGESVTLGEMNAVADHQAIDKEGDATLGVFASGT